MIFCDEKFSRTGKLITYFIVVSCPNKTSRGGGLRDGDVDFLFVFQGFQCAGGMDGDIDF